MVQDGWAVVSRKIAARAAGQCELCSASTQRIETHEIWSYGDGYQTLTGLIGLCRACHEVKHFDVARQRGEEVAALEHLCAVNGWNRIEALAHIDAAIKECDERSYRTWSFDATAGEGLMDAPLGAVVEPFGRKLQAEWEAAEMDGGREL